MPSPIANTDGNGVILVTSNVTGAFGAGTEQKIDVALGKPVLEALADIANAFHIRKTALTNANGRYALGLRGTDSALIDLSLTFLQAGVNEGDLLILETV